MSTADNYKSYFFNIAELNVKITFKESRYNSMRLLPSFAQFKTAEEGKDLFFHLTIDDELPPVREGKTRIDSFDTGNGHTIVDKLQD